MICGLLPLPRKRKQLDVFFVLPITLARRRESVKMAIVAATEKYYRNAKFLHYAFNTHMKFGLKFGLNKACDE